MTQHSVGAGQGAFWKKPLDPNLLESSFNDESNGSKRIKVTKFKREASNNKVAGGADQAENMPLEDHHDNGLVERKHLQVVAPAGLPESPEGYDIYFTKDYARVNEVLENGEAKFFEIKSKNGHVTHSAIKRKIYTTIDGEQYYDLISPYGYGGPVIHDAVNRDKLAAEFKECFGLYCANNNIVSEFIRFHPLYQNQDDFADVYDLTYLRQTVGTNFKKFEDTFQNEFSRTARTKVRKRLRDDRFTFHVERGFRNIGAFIDIYNLTMERHNATDFYYFNKEYFYALREKFEKQLLTISVKFEGKTVAMGLYFLSGNLIHDHLNGTDPDYLEFSPAYLLKYASMKWGVENGYTLIHYGGGVSNAEDDPVLHFKKRFSKHTEFKFHIGKKIWNPEVYNQLCNLRGMDRDRSFFPAYR